MVNKISKLTRGHRNSKKFNLNFSKMTTYHDSLLCKINSRFINREVYLKYSYIFIRSTNTLLLYNISLTIKSSVYVLTGMFQKYLFFKNPFVSLILSVDFIFVTEKYSIVMARYAVFFGILLLCIKYHMNTYYWLKGLSPNERLYENIIQHRPTGRGKK